MPGDVTARPAEKEEPGRPLPPLDPEEAAAIESAADELEREPVGPQLDPRPQVVELVGGRVSVSIIEQSIVLNAASPRPGYVADLRFDRFDELTVSFWNGQHLSSVTVTITEEGGLDLVPEEATT